MEGSTGRVCVLIRMGGRNAPEPELLLTEGAVLKQNWGCFLGKQNEQGVGGSLEALEAAST